MKISMRYQKPANEICRRFGMSPIPVVINRRLKQYWGLYRGNRIELESQAHIGTVYHELAHYLHEYRYQWKIKGYYRTEKWPAMEPYKDHPGWYAAIGKPETVYFKQSSHGKAFKRCLDDILQAGQGGRKR